MTEKLLRRHPHVFGDSNAKTVDAVWAQWDRIKHAEKKGTHRERTSVFDGVPKHLPALMRAEKIVKKARKAKLIENGKAKARSQKAVAEELYRLAEYAQSKGWSAEDLLRAELNKREKGWRQAERRKVEGEPES
jgi:XTP/dITP diphosphohydrolase